MKTILILILILILATPAAAWQLHAVVVEVYDGDSFLIFKPNAKHDRVRMLGIDAPEKGSAFWH